MTLAMALNNSFEIMSEDEMYDVNGGVTTHKKFGARYAWTFSKLECVVLHRVLRDLASRAAVSTGVIVIALALTGIGSTIASAVGAIVAGSLGHYANKFSDGASANGLKLYVWGSTTVVR